MFNDRGQSVQIIRVYKRLETAVTAREEFLEQAGHKLHLDGSVGFVSSPAKGLT